MKRTLVCEYMVGDVRHRVVLVDGEPVLERMNLDALGEPSWGAAWFEIEAGAGHRTGEVWSRGDMGKEIVRHVAAAVLKFHATPPESET